MNEIFPEWLKKYCTKVPFESEKEVNNASKELLHVLIKNKKPVSFLINDQRYLLSYIDGKLDLKCIEKKK